MSQLPPFHLAIPVRELEKTRTFYKTILDCKEGRSSEIGVDLDCFGHQLVLHIADHQSQDNSNHVDGHDVPVPHFGVVLTMEEWKGLADRIKNHHMNFIMEPYIHFKWEPGDQATMFFKDPSGNALEFQAFQNLDQLLAK